MVNVAVIGCAHGELDNIFHLVRYMMTQKNVAIDLLICCGDFQAVRNRQEMESMAVPAKFRRMTDFHRYYDGSAQAPVLTIFVGGNHEASSYMAELPYGGWVAPNIYYLGIAGVVNVCGLRIAGLSGIYKSHDYYRGHFEVPPYSNSTVRSVYHTRSEDVFRLKCIRQPIDVFVSHEWPLGIHHFGDYSTLFTRKPFLRDDAENDQLGSPPGRELLEQLKPRFWFAAHLHVKFAAFCDHGAGRSTRFLALDKCLPHRKFAQVVQIPTSGAENVPAKLMYDLEWLAILRQTDHLMKSFVKTAPAEADLNGHTTVLPFYLNPQTKIFCDKLGITDIPSILQKRVPTSVSSKESKDDPSGSSSIFDSFLSSTTATFSESSFNPDEILLDETGSEAVEKEISTCENDLSFAGLKRVISCDSGAPAMLKRRNESIYSDTPE
ncbi:unnamed protein product [Soboliphyme baturini]|uniref:DBR1 domain-containing protein n=1 Tax=Soboliphyme baturini TaxID=241478 RepID=A0A183J7K4_9BILA|nr:unnamed protein product [Soboliphyme baturini]